MVNKSRINGLVLAGGSSSGMGMGIDKRLINFHGVPQGEYLFNLLQKYCDQVFTSCNTHQQVSRCFNPLQDSFEIRG
ncbi:MAG: NTP transferase domain-containing protein, partial [Bacteroidota bacterium]